MFEKNKEKRRQLEFEKDTYFHRRYGIHWEIAKDLVQILHIMIAGVFTLFVMSIITQYDNFSGTQKYFHSLIASIHSQYVVFFHLS